MKAPRRTIFGPSWVSPLALPIEVPAIPPRQSAVVRRVGMNTPAPWFRAPGGCNMPLSALSESQEYLVLGFANPYATNWIPATIEQVWALGKTTPLPNVGAILHGGDGGRRTDDIERWHHISISVQGEVIWRTELGRPANVDRVATSIGTPSTMLKARITLNLGNSRNREFDCDIGAGVELDVKCRSVVSVIPLVPDPDSLPETFPENLQPGFEFAVAVTTCVTCGTAPQGYRCPVTFTQPFFFVGTQIVGFMPVMPEAQEVQVFCIRDDPAGGTVSVGFMTVLPAGQPVPVRTAYGPPGNFVIQSAVRSGPNLSATDRVVIPDTCNALLIGSDSAETNSMDVVQILDI